MASSILDESADSLSFALFEPDVDTRFRPRLIHPGFSSSELTEIAFDESYREAASQKFRHLVIKAHDLSAPAANILKQTCLTLGTDAGVHRHAINCKIDRGDVLISATESQLKKLILKLRPQPFGLKLLAESLSRLLRRQQDLATKPIEVMAVLNLTPDSFSDGGNLNNIDTVLVACENALSAGATILDLGGESTRPGAVAIDTETELHRIIPSLKIIRNAFPEAILSVDTRKAKVASAALEAGANWINDVSGLQFDPEMGDVIAQAQCPFVLMHSQGTPQTMQDAPHYDNVIGDIAHFFYQNIALLSEKGYHLDNLILDPGFGFGKTRTHNLTLLHRLSELTSLGFPVLAAMSRKTFLAPELPPLQRELATAASLAIALQTGVKIVRLHDVAQHMPGIQLVCDTLDLPLK